MSLLQWNKFTRVSVLVSVLVSVVGGCSATVSTSQGKPPLAAVDAGARDATVNDAAASSADANRGPHAGIGLGTDAALGDAASAFVDAGSDARADAMTLAGCSGGALVCNGSRVCADDLLSHFSCGCAKQICSLQACMQGACVGSAYESPWAADPWTSDDQAAYTLQAVESPIKVLRFANSAPTLTPVMVGQETTLTPVNHSQLVADAQYVYFVIEEHTGRTVLRMPKAGGPAQKLATEGTDTIGDFSVAVDASYVYWNGQNGIYRAPIAGGTAELWAAIACAKRLTVAGGWAYFMCPENSGVYRQKTSDAPHTDSSTLVAFATNFYADTGGYWWGGAIAEGDHLYYANHTTVEDVTLSTGAIASYALPVANLLSIHVEGTRLFVLAQLTSGGADELLLFPQLGDPTFHLLSGGDGELDQIDGSSGTWLFLQDNGTMYRVPKP